MFSFFFHSSLLFTPFHNFAYFSLGNNKDTSSMNSEEMTETGRNTIPSLNQNYCWISPFSPNTKNNNTGKIGSNQNSPSFWSPSTLYWSDNNTAGRNCRWESGISPQQGLWDNWDSTKQRPVPSTQQLPPPEQGWRWPIICIHHHTWLPPLPIPSKTMQGRRGSRVTFFFTCRKVQKLKKRGCIWIKKEYRKKEKSSNGENLAGKNASQIKERFRERGFEQVSHRILAVLGDKNHKPPLSRSLETCTKGEFDFFLLFRLV